jgi:hypothetical protein
VVRRSVANPHALAPWSKSWGSRPRCCWDNFGGRPTPASPAARRARDAGRRRARG